ncbi:O-methyltransferase-domain-containing protein [Annulohypoxylon moriforme]|nr:O-methyltransferase-domain-containing protein [Annulohypoxylon moriforme]
MEEETRPELSSRSDSVLGLDRILEDLNSRLTHCLASLESLSPPLVDLLHHETKLPNIENVNRAAQTVDLLHKVQLALDPPALILADHFLGYVKSKCLSAAVDRGVPDALEKGPATLDKLAEMTHSRSDRLGQVLHILCSHGIFAYDAATGTYSHTSASSLLRSSHWTQWHNWVTLYGDQFYDIARGIPDSTREDATRWAAQINYDTDDNMFSFFRSQGWVPQLHRTLGGGAAAQMPGILEDYPWHEVAGGLVMDIGGGGGAFIAGLMRKYPTMRGGIFDLPHVIDHVRPFFRGEGQFSDIGDRVDDGDLIGGDFFESVPPCTVYTMKWCLHDWKDPQAIAILKIIRQNIVIEPNSRLIVLESILSDDHSARLSQYGDINMMMTANGQERTEAQWRNLAALSGWEIRKIWDLRRAWVKAMDFRPILDEP